MSDFSERKWKKGFWVALEMVCSLGSGEPPGVQRESCRRCQLSLSVEAADHHSVDARSHGRLLDRDFHVFKAS